MTHAKTTDTATALEALSADERDILRQYRDDAEELGRRLLYRAHYGNVRAIAEDVLGAILRGEIDGPDGLDERLHEEADSACTYTSTNLRTVYASENWEAGLDELGAADLFDGAEDCGTLFGRLAYFAMRADIRERLALMVGDVEGDAAGLDLDDEDTYPANRTADEDAETCECEDPGCACGGTCAEDSTIELRRIDMDGAAVRFCEDCAGDALDSGVFATADEDDEPDDDEPGRWESVPEGWRHSVTGEVRRSPYDPSTRVPECKGGEVAPSSKVTVASDRASLVEFLRTRATVTLDATQDDTPLEGNVMASGDDEADRAAEADVRQRLEYTEWAWACVRVQAEYLGHTGEDFLGGCSYEDAEDFRKNSGHYEDMVSEALDTLAHSILMDSEAFGELAEELTRRATSKGAHHGSE